MKMKMEIKRRLSVLCASMLYVLAAGHPVLAEDIEVLIGPGGLPRMQPNVLFILDTSSSMSKSIDGTENPPPPIPTRMSILKDVFRALMENRHYQGINVAMMRFSTETRGGYFIYPMRKLGNSTRQDIINASRRLGPNGTTPLSETLYEAARFWSGKSVGFAATTPARNHPGVLDSNGGSIYISPISSSECQKNYTIMFTDGGPWNDVKADADIEENLLNKGKCDGLGVNKFGDGRCLDDVARYLNTVDQNSDIPGTQTVQTYVISFASNQSENQSLGEQKNQEALKQTAEAGGGTYILAADKEELGEAFTSILEVIANANDSFSPPALAANTFNGIAHINRLYYTLFEPAATPKWNGNVKPYKLNDAYQLVDATPDPARPVIGEDGMFLKQSRSFWSDTDDGANIVIGGANSRLPASINRNLYTYTGDYDDKTGLIPDTPGINAFNLDADNSHLTADMLDISITDDNGEEDSTRTNAEFARVLDVIRNTNIGAPLHSQPVLVTYGGENTKNADLTLFVATNDGFLHALDASPKKEGTTEGGKELFAFIPKELLPNLPKLAGKTGSMVYGLDGSISAWVKESNDPDSTIDHVYIYVGMRRGGNNYYALDVTDRTAPTLKWVIRGGPGGTPGFEELGQSWSKPTLASIEYGDGKSRQVLIFGGGYDHKAQDDHPTNANAQGDTIGRAIFIVDADTGERLWWAGPTDSDADLKLGKMTHSIPSDIRLMDSNNDGYTDRLYVGDMRGQIFRIDLKPTLTNSTGVLLASLSGDTAADHRRFYYPPDVVLTQRRGASPYISINIGSGYRAHPLNPLNTDGTAATRVNDRFYSLRDPLVAGSVPTDEILRDGNDGNLSDVTGSLVVSSTDIAKGWYITLGNGSGEKVLASSITINGEIFFTTYTPPELVEQSECSPPPGVGRLYRVSLFDGTPTRNEAEANNSDPETLTLEDRAQILRRPGIPPSPAVIFRKNSDGNVEIVNCVDTQCEGMNNPNPIREIYWQDGLNTGVSKKYSAKKSTTP